MFIWKMTSFAYLGIFLEYFVMEFCQKSGFFSQPSFYFIDNPFLECPNASG
jgi:hypothetical protein